MLVKDIQDCDYIMLYELNKDIIMAHVSVIGFHMITVFLSQPVISLNARA